MNEIQGREINQKEPLTSTRKSWIVFFVVLGIVFFLFALSFFLGSTDLSPDRSFLGLFGQADNATNRIMQRIRLPRNIGAFIIGGGLALSGLIMQTSLKNPMASPATLGISNAAVFGANVIILAIYGTGSNSFVSVNDSPFTVSAVAFAFALLCVLIVLGLSSFHQFNPTTVVLIGIALGAGFQAGTTLLQYFSDDVALSAVVGWSFGNLERLTMEENYILLLVVGVSLLGFEVFSYRYNALSGGEGFARSLGVHTSLLRFVSLLVASLIAALCVSFCGIIGFVGIIAPHIMKRIIGNDHRFLIPTSFFAGASMLLFCDIATRLIGQGTSLPVGAITALIGTPFFLFILFTKKGKAYDFR